MSVVDTKEYFGGMQRAGSNSPYHPLCAAFAKLICFVTVGLIFAGGVVTSNNAGLSVPDWPTSFGYHLWAMPFSLWKGGVLYEHFHRVFASVAGILVMAMAVWLVIAEPRRRLRTIGLLCVAVVIAQGILGGLTVLYALPTPVSVAHGVLAQTFLCLTIVLAYGLSRERHERVQQAGEVAAPEGFRRGVLAVFALVFLQLVIAAWMRHDFKRLGGVAVPDFPKIAGHWRPWADAHAVDWVNTWRAEAVTQHHADFVLDPPVRRYQLDLHLLHRGMALVLTGAFVWLTVAGHRHYPVGHRVRRTIEALDALLMVQIALGVFVVWSSRGALVTSLHVMVGAATLGTTVLLAMRVLPATWAETPAPGRPGGRPSRVPVETAALLPTSRLPERTP